MTTYVLVHGAWHGGWCWVRVADRLRAAGHRVLTPTLTGLADRSHLLAPTISLQTHIKDVANLLRWEELEGVVLVGHSYGGMVITGAADLAAERIRSLVFVDALLPAHGQSAVDLRTAEANALLRQRARAGGGWRVSPTTAAAFDVNPADRAWVDGKCTDMAIGCFTEKLHLSGAGDRIADRVYIRAGGYANPAFDKALADARGDARFRCHVVDCGHDVMVDAPDVLTRILLESA